MKVLFKHIVNFAMILILLVSTLQFSLYKMDCLMTGNTQVSLSNFDDCNESKKTANSISQKCCEFSYIAFNFNYDSKIDIKEVNILNSSILILNIGKTLLKPVFKKSDTNFYTNLPPPSGYELLKLVQVFRL